MANKRTLKKTVNYITGELFTECVVLKNFVPGVDSNKINDMMARILCMQDEFISRINHPEPGNIKGSYKKIHEDLNKQLNAFIEEISAIN